MLIEHIWSKDDAYDMDFIIAIILGGDDLDYVKKILENGTITNHKRINTFEKLKSIVMDPLGPSIKDALTLCESELLSKHAKMKSLPKTDEEALLKQLDEAVALFSLSTDEVDIVVVEQKEKEEEKKEEKQPRKLEWTSALLQGSNYTWYRTVWYRINASVILYDAVVTCFGKNKYLELKFERFQNAHLRAIQYLDSLTDPSDANINTALLETLYTQLGQSTFDDDKDNVVVTKVKHKVRETPLEIIRFTFPLLPYWTVEEVVEAMRNGSIVGEKENYIDDEWAPIPEAKIETHSIYFACIFVLNQCRSCMLQQQTTEQQRDALWLYYVGFTDVFYYNVCNGMSDATLLTPIGSKQQRGGGMWQSDHLSPWELYGGPHIETRAFHAGDLPDLFHVINAIPLWGEQDTPNFRLGKMYQKAYPYACQRRRLVKLIVDTIHEDDAFWRLFQKLFWTMLTGLYPGELGICDTLISMRDLLRIKEITDTKESLIHALTVNQPGPNPKASGANGGPLIVVVAFALHILYITSYNPTFVQYAKKCIDWDYFRRNTIDLVRLIRGTTLFPDDPFGQARKLLSKTVKSPNTRVHRFRRQSESVAITFHLNETLEKLIIKDKHARIADVLLLRTLILEEDQDKKLEDFQFMMRDFESNVTFNNLNQSISQRLDVNQNAIKFYEHAFESARHCKAAILNILIRLPISERLSIDAFSLLTLPQYGGISFVSVQRMCKMTHIYFDNAVPKDFRHCIDSMDAKDFVVICFYFNMVSLLEKINFVQLDADTVKRTDCAMQTVRYHMYPGQPLPEEVYNVHISLCCQKICNLKGFGKYGSKKVAFNMETQSFVCSSGKSLKAAAAAAAMEVEEDENEEDEDEEDNSNDAAEVDNIATVLEAQNDEVEDYVSSIGKVKISDFVGDAVKKKGRGTQRSIEMDARKAIRNERKTYNKIPCGQPVLTISLRGRALIWGNILEKKTRIMFCPSCGALHIYTILNFANAENGLYRCNECAQKEMRHVEHRRCAYCDRTIAGQMSEQFKLMIMNPYDESALITPQSVSQLLYFCKGHFKIARRFNTRLLKPDLWNKIKEVEHKNMISNVERFG